ETGRSGGKNIIYNDYCFIFDCGYIIHSEGIHHILPTLFEAESGLCARVFRSDHTFQTAYFEIRPGLLKSAGHLKGLIKSSVAKLQVMQRNRQKHGVVLAQILIQQWVLSATLSKFSSQINAYSGKALIFQQVKQILKIP